jgi:hypothetical protein
MFFFFSIICKEGAGEEAEVRYWLAMVRWKFGIKEKVIEDR